MRLEIKKAEIENFKGISRRECVFSEGITDIRGANGSGKTTIATAIDWVMCDMDYQLNSKPTVQPLNSIEVKPRVKLWLDVDGREITVEKTQKTTVKEDANSGKITQTTTNTYAVNDVPKAYRDFVLYFSELGIDLGKFAMLSHPDVFTRDDSKKGREQMREVLFKMASEMSDLEIAKEMTGIAELTIDLGRGYKLDEVKAMNAATIKRIETDNGKDNRLIDARISGLLEGKAEVSPNGLAEREKNAKAAITHIETEIKILENENNKELKIKELEAKIKELEIQAKEDFYKARNAHTEKRNDLIDKYREVEEAINRANKAIAEHEATVDNSKKLLDSLRKDYGDVFDKQFDGDTTCPVCKRELPEDMIAEAKANFEKSKAANLATIKKSAETINKDIEDAYKTIADAKETVSRMSPSLEMLKEQLDECEQESITEPRLEDIPGVAELQAEINELKAQTVNSSNEKLNSLNEALSKAKNVLSEVEGTYKVIENNKLIDSKIDDLLRKKSEDEISKAMAEKMLYQVEQLERFKNEKLTAEINKHFNLVEWKFFTYNKNGGYQECCIPTFEGKSIDTATNTALSVLMRIDIAESLQRFNNLSVPIVIDCAERLDANSRKRINAECQLIYLTVSDDEEIVVKGA